MNLLKSTKTGGFPRAYLLARICGRRAAIGGRALSWRELTREYAWVYARLDNGAARALTPYFSLFELKRLLTCLRLLRGQDASRISALLSESLMRVSLQRQLLKEGDFARTLHQIIVDLNLGDVSIERVEEFLERQDWSQLEEEIFDAGLHQALKGSRSRIVQTFFRELIDVRNLQALGKAMHWQQKRAPSFLAGGDIPTRRLQRAFANGDTASTARLAREKEQPTPTGAFEERLLHRLEQRLQRVAREQGGIAQVLHYLWSLYLSTRTRGETGIMAPVERTT